MNHFPLITTAYCNNLKTAQPLSFAGQIASYILLFVFIMAPLSLPLSMPLSHGHGAVRARAIAFRWWKFAGHAVLLRKRAGNIRVYGSSPSLSLGAPIHSSSSLPFPPWPEHAPRPAFGYLPGNNRENTNNAARVALLLWRWPTGGAPPRASHLFAAE